MEGDPSGQSALRRRDPDDPLLGRREDVCVDAYALYDGAGSCGGAEVDRLGAAVPLFLQSLPWWIRSPSTVRTNPESVKMLRKAVELLTQMVSRCAVRGNGVLETVMIVELVQSALTMRVPVSTSP